MARAKTASKKSATSKKQPKLYTLTEVSEVTGISLPTLQRYKKNFQARIPAVGEGRRQRYPEEALGVFATIKEENMKKRGRPRKTAAAKKTTAKKTATKTKAARKSASKKTPATKKPSKRKPTKKKAAKKKTASKTAAKKTAPKAAKKPAAKTGTAGESADLLSLLAISGRTGISYPTLRNYVMKHLDQIPHVGVGRARRFPEEAVEVFVRLRGQARRGGRRVSAQVVQAREAVLTDPRLAKRIQDLEKAQAAVGKQLDAVLAILKKPLKLTINS